MPQINIWVSLLTMIIRPDSFNVETISKIAHEGKISLISLSCANNYCGELVLCKIFVATRLSLEKEFEVELAGKV